MHVIYFQLISYTHREFMSRYFTLETINKLNVNTRQSVAALFR